MTAFYNEIDPFAAQWLRNLISAGHIAPGVVDTRSISEIAPDELRQYTQCHFFAGIGVWSHALRLAEWPDSRPVWTGSCPCQPFSVAGRNAGVRDERHLWPHWFHLIEQCRPAVVFGEQVEAAIGHGWLDLVQADLEGCGYAVGHAGIPAAGVGAPHIRQRLWFVAHPQCGTAERWGHDLGAEARSVESEARQRQRVRADSGAGELAGALAHHHHQGLEGRGAVRQRAVECSAGPSGVVVGLADADAQHQRSADYRARAGNTAREGEDSNWANAEWISCRDGKARPTQPGLFPLAHGATGRVGRLRAYGNAIVPQAAAEVIGAYLDNELA